MFAIKVSLLSFVGKPRPRTTKRFTKHDKVLDALGFTSKGQQNAGNEMRNSLFYSVSKLSENTN